MNKIQIITAISIITFLFFSCRKESFISSPDARLSLSADSIKFDTVFTTVGSITQSFKIFNDNDQKLLLSKVKLMGGAGSAYKININGLAVIEADNIELAANDSIYIFVTVNVNPSAANLPFIISDSILINYNGNNRFVQLQSYGQNAHFLNNTMIAANTVWPNDLPYVILGGIQIDTAISLTINAGCRIYSHANAPFIVDGTLIINGTKGNEVQFASDRLDEPYKNFPGGWPGIYFRGKSQDNEITFAVIKNAYQALVLDGPSINANPKLQMHQCIIDNAYDAGILSFNSSIRADNSLISNCGKNINIALGGDYVFTNCTIASYSNNFLSHKSPVLTATDIAEQNGSIISADLNAIFRNCIFWGDNNIVENEAVISKQGSSIFNVLFDHSLYKAIDDPANSILTAVIRNSDPSFDSIDVSNKYYDFRITKNLLAPGIDQGAAIGFLKDLDDNNRIVGQPDLGCYEKQ